MGQAAELLERYELPQDPLRARRMLPDGVPVEVARAAIELADLRRRAPDKFREPERMLLTRKGLEQATRLGVATWRAREVARLVPGAQVWDQTAGLGAECLALLGAGLEVRATELDPLAAACCAANLAGSRAVVRTGDCLEEDEPADVVLLDPDRRSDEDSASRGLPGGGRRRLDPASFAPPVGTWARALGTARGGCVKLPPGLDPAELESQLAAFLEATPHRWTWVEAAGALRELTLWTGTLAPPSEPHRRAVRLWELPDGSLRQADLDGPAPGAPAPPAGWPRPAATPDQLTVLAEPRPAALRAGLEHWAAAELPELGLTRLDPGAAYLGGTGVELPPHSGAFLDLFRVLGCAPLDTKHVRRLLAEHGIGPLTVKKRGIDLTAEQLARRFGRKRGLPGLAIVGPTPAGRRFFLVERLTHQAP